jgi:hypothetical protein
MSDPPDVTRYIVTRYKCPDQMPATPGTTAAVGCGTTLAATPLAGHGFSVNGATRSGSGAQGDLIADAHYGQLSALLRERGMGRYGESHENGRAFIGDGPLGDCPQSLDHSQLSPGTGRKEVSIAVHAKAPRKARAQGPFS